MLWQKQIKAGVMLYALLMTAIFSLLLQFYLNRQMAAARNHQASLQSLTAYTMAQWTKQKLEKELIFQNSAIEENQSETGGIETIKDGSSFSFPHSQVQDEALGEAETSPSSQADNQAEGESGQKSENGKEGGQFSGTGGAARAAGDTTVPAEEKTASLPAQGELQFGEGRAAYQLEKDLLSVKVDLDQGGSYSYRFYIDSQKD